MARQLPRPRKYAFKFLAIRPQKRLGKPTRFLKGDRKSASRLQRFLWFIARRQMDDEATTDDDLQEDLPHLEMPHTCVWQAFAL